MFASELHAINRMVNRQIVEREYDRRKKKHTVKVMKMIYEALFSPSPHDELYKPSELLPGMTFYYLITAIVVIVVLYLVLRYFGFL